MKQTDLTKRWHKEIVITYASQRILSVALPTDTDYTGFATTLKLSRVIYDWVVSTASRENLEAEAKSAEADWTSAVGVLAIYRLDPSEKEIHSRFLRSYPIRAIAFHDQSAGALFAAAPIFSYQQANKTARTICAGCWCMP